jgi:hypothetical protein
MSLQPTPALPRPEDRCRGELERLLGCAGPQAIWRSEAFAEDLPVDELAAGSSPTARKAESWLRRVRAAWQAPAAMTLQPGR